ncbi:PaaI family thioesterase [Streptomyces olivaceoviridis]|uniref:PaaI family thioesterase n=1 Tax=Streptomyces olivaceoviridis TaxID=1921 RepID=UPI0037BD3E09
MPYARGTGIRLEKADSSLVRGTLPWAEHLCTAGGLLHGGAVMSLADTVGAVCAYLNMPPGAATSTVESKTNFFRGVRSGNVTAVARPLHVGSSFVVVQTELSDDEDRRVALTIQSQAVLRPGHPRREPAPD